MDEDLAEMAALRQASKFRSHRATYGGSRAAARAEKEEAERRAEAERRRQEEIEAREQQRMYNSKLQPDVAKNDDDEDDVKEFKSRSSVSSSSSVPIISANLGLGAGEDAPSVVVDNEEEMMRQFFPTSFGTKSKSVDMAQVHAKNARAAKLAAEAKEKEKAKEQPKESKAEDSASVTRGTKRSVEAEEETKSHGDDEEDDESLPSSAGNRLSKYALPITHDVELKGHDRAVSALSVDKSGARVLTGSYDYTVKFFDFAGMTDSMQSFRSIEPEEGHQVRHIAWNERGNQFLVATGSARPKLYDREGHELAHYIRGDMYIQDLANTSGHVTATTGICWHPNNREQFLSCSIDGTLRLWDVNMTKKNLHVLKLKSVVPGKRATVTACAFSPNAAIIAGAGNDGSIQLWNAKAARYSRVDKTVQKAHQIDTETSSLVFADDSVTLLSRGGDHTLKVWDVRKFREPVATFNDLENFYPETDACFSPDGKLILTGTSHKAGAEDEGQGSRGEAGQLVFIDRSNMQIAQRVTVTPKSVVRVAWHGGINQVFAACSDGQTHVLYDPTKSVKGALLSVGKKSRAKDPADFQTYYDIHNPHALPMFRREANSKKQRIKDAKDPIKGHIPELPLSGPHGHGGRVASSRITQHFISKIITKKPNSREEDPREALIKWDDAARADPMFLGRAYAKTQPKPVLHPLTEEREQEMISCSAREAVEKLTDKHQQ